MQQCKSAEGLCKGGKVNAETEDRVQSTEDGGANKGDWLARVWSIGGRARRRVQSTEYRLRREGRGVASPRPPWLGVQGEATPLPEAEPFPNRQTLTAIRQRWHAVPTLPEAVRTGVDWRTDATQSRLYPMHGGPGTGRRLVCLLRTLSSFPLPTCFQRGDWSKWSSPLYALGYPLSHHRWTDPRVLRPGSVR